MGPVLTSDVGSVNHTDGSQHPANGLFLDSRDVAELNGGGSIPFHDEVDDDELTSQYVMAALPDCVLITQVQDKPRSNSVVSQKSLASNASGGIRPPEIGLATPVARERQVSETESAVTSTDSWVGEKEAAAPTVPSPLAPPDGGWGWMIVVGTILAGALIPSLFICFGVLMNDLLDIFPEANKSTASWIPSIMNSLMNCMGPITSALVSIYSVKSVTFVGGLVLSSGLVLSFFTNSITALYFTYGLLGGIGAGLSLAPGFYLISQYFKKRRGLATGICMAGSSLGQMVLPHIIRWFLEMYGYRGCILVLGGMTLNICVSACLFRSLEDNAARKPVVSNATKSSRRRTVSQSSRRSSFTFIPDEGIYLGGKSAPKNGNRKSSSSRPKIRHRKSNKKTRSSGGVVKKGKRPTTNSIEKDVHLAAMERMWQQAKLAEAETPSPPRSRSRTLSLDSCRILPGIPEEHEEEKFESCDEGEPEVVLEVEEADEACVDSDDVQGWHEDDVQTEPDERRPMLSDDGRPTPEIVQNNNKSVYASPPEGDIGTNGGHAGSADVYEDCKVELGAPHEEDAGAEQRRRNAFLQRQSSTTSDVSLHHHFCGSVASVNSICGATVPPQVKRGPLQIMVHFYRSMAFGTFFRLGLFYILTASFSLMIVTLANFSMFVPPYGMTVGLSRDESAGLISFIAVASMCGRLLMPALTDWLQNGKKHLYSACCLLTAAAIIMTTFSDSYTMLLVSLVIFGFASGGSIAISINVFLDYVPLQLFTAFYGLVQFVLGVVILFVTPIMGLMVDKTGSFVPTFVTLAIGSLISASILYLDRFVKPISPTTTIPT